MLTLPSLSKGFATLLNLATKTNQQIDMTPLEGRSFSLAIDELPQDIAIKIENGKVEELSAENLADVTISGNIKAIINMIQDEADGLDSDELYISGKIGAAKHFQHFLADLSIDWQGFFSQFLPKEIADKTAEAVEQGIHFAKASAEQLAENVKHYILSDKKLLVTRSEYLQFKQETEQLTEKIEQLLKQLNTTEKR